jgi:DNA (cytosine-5)-methyltransferase 1
LGIFKITRYFIFENVKGLLSDDNGKTFQEWVNMLGGKSVNGVPVIFPYEDSVPYHLYWKVLNAKEHGVPQNRERVFIIGIRDDSDNNFRFQAEEFLRKRLKDIIENDIDDKYFLSENKIDYLIKNQEKRALPFLDNDKEISSCIVATYFKQPTDGQYLKVGTYNDKRLNYTIFKNELPKGSPMMLDTYNQSIHEECPTLKARHAQNNDRKLWDGYKIRRLTPRECFRLMDFPDTFTWICSDSQAYKQAGNSIVVNVLYKILKNLNL